MGAAASITKNDAEIYPQYQMLGGSSRFAELKDDDGNVSLDKIQDPYLVHGGAYTGDDKDTLGFKYIAYSELPTFSGDHKSILKSVLTAEVFDELKDVKTSTGFSLSNTIQAGIIIPSANIGISAGDEESYAVFQSLYNPAISAIHHIEVSSNSQSKKITSDIDLSADNATLLKEFVTGLKVVAHRNISGYSFPCGSNADDRQAVDDTMKSFCESSAAIKGSYYSLASLSDEDSLALASSGNIMPAPAGNRYLTATGAGRSWPKSRSVYVTEDKDISMWINHENHVRISVSDNDSDFNRLLGKYSAFHMEVETYLESSGKKFAWSDSLGYLNSSFANLGVAITASVIGLFPYLVKADVLADLSSSMNLSVVMMEDGKLEISTKSCLGVTEAQVMNAFVESLLSMVSFEKQLADGASPDDVCKKLMKDEEVRSTVEDPAESTVESPTSVTVTAVRDMEASIPVADILSSPKASNKLPGAGFPGSPKKTPTSSRSSFHPAKSPSNAAKSPVALFSSNNDAGLVALTEETPVVQNQPTVDEVKPVVEETQSKKKYVSAGFMSGKFNNKLKIEIDELQFPGDHHLE